MDYTLVLEVPENIYETLAKTAQRTGQTPEEVVMEWLEIAIQHMLDDPVESFTVTPPQTSPPKWHLPAGPNPGAGAGDPRP